MAPVRNVGRDDGDAVPQSDKSRPMLGIPLQSSRSGSRARRPSAAAATKGDSVSRLTPRALRPATEDRPRTDAELAREASVRADPLAEVLSPLWVRCRRCSQRIKLSPKSYFDLFHWQKHRERCLRRPAEELRSASPVEDTQPPVRVPSCAAPVEDCGSGDQDIMPQVQEEPDRAASPALSTASPLSPLSVSRSASTTNDADCRASEGTSVDDYNETTTPPPPYYPHDIFEHSPIFSPYSYAALPGVDIPLERTDLDAAATLTSFNTTSPALLFAQNRRAPSERAPPLLEPRTPLLYDPRAQPLQSPTSWQDWTYDYLSPSIWTVGKSSREPLDVRVPTSNVRASE
ncbi:hypothetical protein PENSPDRAFT_655994 [Peniophora sp. CONT]|nr:hypothetical protein PENSPDRAFT_655994 [Peniophora sp. CONT]